MKNTAKYYAPKIEEFHVGFQYEEADYVGQKNETWENQICGIDNTGDLEFYKDLILEKSVRVKFLDRKDIEDLGFVYTIKKEQIRFCYK